MGSSSRHQFRADTSRRSPWGPPRWISGVSFGSAALLRDHAEGADPSSPGSGRPPRRHPEPGGWAPWWLYVVVIVGTTHLRRAAGVDGSTPAARVVIALAVSAALFVTITLGYRAFVRRRGSHRD